MAARVRHGNYFFRIPDIQSWCCTNNSSLCRICQVQETIDQMVQWRETARLSPGQVAEAIIINILCKIPDGKEKRWILP